MSSTVLGGGGVEAPSHHTELFKHSPRTHRLSLALPAPGGMALTHLGASVGLLWQACAEYFHSVSFLTAPHLQPPEPAFSMNLDRSIQLTPMCHHSGDGMASVTELAHGFQSFHRPSSMTLICPALDRTILHVSLPLSSRCAQTCLTGAVYKTRNCLSSNIYTLVLSMGNIP